MNRTDETYDAEKNQTSLCHIPRQVLQSGYQPHGTGTIIVSSLKDMTSEEMAEPQRQFVSADGFWTKHGTCLKSDNIQWAPMLWNVSIIGSWFLDGCQSPRSVVVSEFIQGLAFSLEAFLTHSPNRSPCRPCSTQVHQDLSTFPLATWQSEHNFFEVWAEWLRLSQMEFLEKCFDHSLITSRISLLQVDQESSSDADRKCPVVMSYIPEWSRYCPRALCNICPIWSSPAVQCFM